MMTIDEAQRQIERLREERDGWKSDAEGYQILIASLRDENVALRESFRQYGRLVRVRSSAIDKLLDLADDMLYVIDRFYGCDEPCPHSSDCRECCLFETRLKAIRMEVGE